MWRGSGAMKIVARIVKWGILAVVGLVPPAVAGRLPLAAHGFLHPHQRNSAPDPLVPYPSFDQWLA